jgi:GH43 family beta-xylosidase
VEQRPLLATTEQLVGPGHNSLTTAPDGTDVIAFHAWDSQLDRRRLHLRHLHIEGGLVTAQ